MLNRKITLTIWAISLISLLGLVNLAINPINEAKALQQFEITPPATPTMVRTTSYGSKIYTVIFGVTSGQPFADVYNATTSNLIQAYNLTVGTGFTTGNTLAGANCGPTHGNCVVGYHVTGHSDRVFLFDVKDGWVQTTAGGTPYTANFVQSVVYSETLNQDQVFVMKKDGVSPKIDNWVVPTTVGQTAFTTTPLIFGYTYDTGFSNSVAINDMELGYFNTTSSPSSIQQYLAWTSPTNNLFVVIDIGARATKCQTNISGDTATLDVQYMNDTSNGVNNVNGIDWLVSGTTATNKFIKVDNSCNLKTTYTINTITLTDNPIRSLGFSASRHEIYAYAGASRNSLIVINATKIGATALQSWVNNIYQMSEDHTAFLYNGIMTSPTSQGMVAVGETTKLYWLYWVQSGSNGQSGGSSTRQETYTDSNGNTCIDIYDTTGSIKLTTFCSNAGSGGHIATNTLRLVNTGANVSNTGFVLGCGAGFISCTNANAQTNGVGLIILGIVILISYVFVVSIHYGVKHNLMKQNVVLQEVMRVDPFILIVMVFTDVAILWQVKLIPDIYFYSMVVLIAGFTAFGIYRHTRP